MITFNGEVSDKARLYIKKSGANALITVVCKFSVLFLIGVVYG